MNEKRQLTWLMAGLVALIVALYAHVFQCDFIHFDDDTHVFRNPMVVGGLTWPAVVHAFTSFHASQWIPLTWLSHMLDVSVFGLDPAGPHLENVAFHALNACLVLLAFRQLTGQFWASSAVALLFAVHPINVESVAWIAERKNVLSTTFWLLAMVTYARYVETRQKRWMAWTAVCMAIGLLAKPMLVTLPCALLLLDGWPLRRSAQTPWWRLVLEKWPLWLLTAAISLSTLLAAKSAGTLTGAETLPLVERLGTALLSYPRYLAHLFYPAKLGVLYSLTSLPSASVLVMAGALLAGLTVAAWLLRGRCPWILSGWLWFVGTLVPVSGVFQVGSQALADRFAYIPQLGLFWGLVWSFQALPAARWPWRPALLGATAVLLSILTIRQVSHWTDTTTLFEHTLRVTRGNGVTYAIAGRGRSERGDWPLAAEHFRRSTLLMPDNSDVLVLYGEALFKIGNRAEAAEQFRTALKIDPQNEAARRSLVGILAGEGKLEEARQWIPAPESR